MNMTTAPNSELARRAVVTALDRPALARLGGELVKPDCCSLPDGIKRHPGAIAHTVTRTPRRRGGGARARSRVGHGRAADRRLGRGQNPAAGVRPLLRAAAAPARLPRLRAAPTALELLPYRGKRGDQSADGARQLVQRLPEPDRLLHRGRRELDPTNGEPEPRSGQRPVRARATQALNLVPAEEPLSAADAWRELDQYTARKAYLAVFGSQQVPKLIRRSPRPRFGHHPSVVPERLEQLVIEGCIGVSRVLGLDYGTARWLCDLRPDRDAVRPLAAVEPPDPGDRRAGFRTRRRPRGRRFAHHPGVEEGDQARLSRAFAWSCPSFGCTRGDLRRAADDADGGEKRAEGARADRDSLAAAHLLESYLAGKRG